MTELEARTLCIDLDLVICSSASDYADAQPLPGAFDALKELHRAGWVIVLHTARHFNHWQKTVDWLKQHKITYDQIVFGKPPARFYIDDRALLFDGDWDKLVPAILKVANERA